MSKRQPTHDSGHKLLFAHAAIVKDLLRGFMPGTWVRELDLRTLERAGGSYVSDDLRDRTDDIIWRVRWGQDGLYVYLPLEFPSRVDPWMPVRIQVAIWFGRVVLPKRLPGVPFPPLTDRIEVYHMLAENLEAWTDQWKQEGLEQGLEQGRELGLELGREAVRHILIRHVRRCFGPVIAEQTVPWLARILDLQLLEDLGDQLLVSQDGAAWLQALREASPETD